MDSLTKTPSERSLAIDMPARNDYQLSENASGRVNHVNVYDEKILIATGGRPKRTSGLPIRQVNPITSWCRAAAPSWYRRRMEPVPIAERIGNPMGS